MLFVSGLVPTILIAQFIASFGDSDRYFPFLWYPMYAQPRYDGDRLVVHHSLFAVVADGGRHRVLPEDLNINFWRFERVVISAVKKQDWERLETPLSQIRSLHPHVVRLEIEDNPLVITSQGPASAPRQLVASLSLEGEK